MDFWKGPAGDGDITPQIGTIFYASTTTRSFRFNIYKILKLLYAGSEE